MALAGPDERRLTARTTEFRRKRKIPLSQSQMTARKIEAMKGVKYLSRAREKDSPWGYAR